MSQRIDLKHDEPYEKVTRKHWANEEGARPDRGTKNLRPLNPEYNKVLRNRLRSNSAALDHLYKLGIADTTMSYFRLGLSLPYLNRKTNQEQSNALVYPLLARDGDFYNKYGYYNIPGVTKNPASGDGWAAGEARTLYGEAIGGQKSLFVCQSALDLWKIWQEIRSDSLSKELALITSTHGIQPPESWKSPSFWAPWEKVYFAHHANDIGDMCAAKLAEWTGREVLRVRIPQYFGEDWVSFWKAGSSTERFTSLLTDARAVSAKVLLDKGDAPAFGRFPYQPVNINCAYHNGHLYHTVQVLNRDVDVERRVSGEEVVTEVERLETVVVRSDRTVHYAVRTPAPAGTRDRDRVLRLTDGTLLEREPQPNRYSTWSWTSIRAYLEGGVRTRPLGEILGDVKAHLKSSVWLPREEDYAIMTLTVPVTYAQRIFDSVPLLFLNGPPGSGKSEMGRAMARVCANAYVCGQSSAASIARFIDESRGFVVLDDLEMIGSRGGEFSELAQSLKLSYNKTTAVKLWTDVKTMRPQLLDFYGVKMINNTRGTDEILGSRMLRIQTQRIPEDIKAGFAALKLSAPGKLRDIRDELHTWTFENIELIEMEYKRLCPKGSERANEITAPLKVIATLAADQELRSHLEIALARQGQASVDLDRPLKVLHEVLRRLVAQGYTRVSVTHVALEARYLYSQHDGAHSQTRLSEWTKPEVVGRLLRGAGLVEAKTERVKRMRVWGANLRFYPISESFIKNVKDTYTKEGVDISIDRKMPEGFCQACETCAYRRLSCEIMIRKNDEQKRSRGQPNFSH